MVSQIEMCLCKFQSEIAVILVNMMFFVQVDAAYVSYKLPRTLYLGIITLMLK